MIIFYKILSLLFTGLFIYSSVRTALTFQKTKGVRVRSLYIAALSAAVVFYLYIFLLALSLNLLLYILMIAGLFAGCAWGMSSKLQYHGGSIFSRGTLWGFIIWATLVAGLQVINLLFNVSPEAVVMILGFKTGLFVGYNLTMALRCGKVKIAAYGTAVSLVFITCLSFFSITFAEIDLSGDWSGNYEYNTDYSYRHRMFFRIDKDGSGNYLVGYASRFSPSEIERQRELMERDNLDYSLECTIIDSDITRNSITFTCKWNFTGSAQESIRTYHGSFKESLHNELIIEGTFEETESWFMDNSVYRTADSTGNWNSSKIPDFSSGSEKTGEEKTAAVPGVGTNPSSPSQQATAAAGAAAVMGLAAFLINKAQTTPLISGGGPSSIISQDYFPENPPVNEKGQVFFQPPWEKHGAYWMDPGEYRQTREMLSQGKAWSDSYGWQDPEDLASYQKQRQGNWARHTARKEDMTLQIRADREERIQAYLNGENVHLNETEMLIANIDMKIQYLRQAPERDALRQKIWDSEAGYDQAMRSYNRLSVGYYGTKFVEKTCDVIIDKGAKILNGGKPAGIGTAIQFSYYSIKNTLVNFAEDGFSIRGLADGVGGAAYDTTAGIIERKYKIDKMGRGTRIMFNTTRNMGKEALFGEGNYDVAIGEGMLDVFVDDALDNYFGEFKPKEVNSLQDALKLNYRELNQGVGDGVSVFYEFGKEVGTEHYVDFKGS